MPLRAAPGRIGSTEHLLYDKQSIPCSQVPRRLPGEITAMRVYLKHKTGSGKYYVRRSQKELRMEGKGREKRRAPFTRENFMQEADTDLRLEG